MLDLPSPYRDDGAGERLSTASVLMLALVVCVCRVLAVHSFHIYDDAFITYRYSQNLAAGHGMVYNPGAPWEPVLGTTTPLYTLLLSLPVWLGAKVEHASLAFNVVLDGLSAFLILRLLAARPLAALLATLAFAAIPEVGRISVGGMESPLFVFLALAAARSAQLGRMSTAGWLAALDCTVRPEGVLLLVALSLAHLRDLKSALRFYVPVAIVGLASVALLTWYFGSPIPQSVQAKASNHGLGPHISRIKDILARSFGPSIAMRFMLPFAGFGFALAVLWRTPIRSFVLFGLGISAAYCLAGVKTWGWYFYVPLVSWCVALGLGLDAVIEFLSRAVPSLRIERTTGALPWALSGLVLTAVAVFSRQHTERVTYHVYQPLAAWCEREGIEAHQPSIVASDIGAIGFFGRTRILDSEGLVWPQARQFSWQVDLIRAHRPDYVLLVANSVRIGPWREDPLYAEYLPLARFNITGDQDLEPDPKQLPPWWEQDYIIYRRRDYVPAVRE